LDIHHLFCQTPTIPPLTGSWVNKIEKNARRLLPNSLLLPGTDAIRRMPLNSRAAREFMVAEVKKLAAVPCAVPSVERRVSARSRRTACGVQHITKFSCNTRIYGCRGAEIVGDPCVVPSVRCCDRAIAATFSRSGDRRSLRSAQRQMRGAAPRGTRHAGAAEGTRDFHIPLNSRAAREFMVAEVKKLS